VEPSIFVEGFGYAEGLRWHDDRLWFSDMVGGRVLAYTGDGHLDRSVEIPQPSGIGFLPDGTMLVVSMGEEAVLAVDRNGRTEPYFEFSHLGVAHNNDMVTDHLGLTYVSATDRDFQLGDELDEAMLGDTSGKITLIDPVSQEGHVVARGLPGPNGMCITADGRRLIAALSYGRQVVSFDRADNGGLSGPTTIAAFDIAQGTPDGIALDEEGGIWIGFGSAGTGFLRVDGQGRVADRIELPGVWSVACALGGADRRTLFLAVCRTTIEEFMRSGRSSGQILAVPVEVPGAGIP
jgi:sugar lactone lactonase YvrE